MNEPEILMPLGLTLCAGLATAVGALFSLGGRASPRLTGLLLGLAGGTMLWIAFVELFAEARATAIAELGWDAGTAVTAGAFVLGALVPLVLDLAVPTRINPHTAAAREATPSTGRRKKAATPLGLIGALAILAHNIPEGMAVFAAGSRELAVGVPVALAVGLHNLPEGAALAALVLAAGGSRMMGLRYALLAGLSEPLGAGLGLLGLQRANLAYDGAPVTAAVAGVLVFLACDQLVPNARDLDTGHEVVLCILAGMAAAAAAGLLL